MSTFHFKMNDLIGYRSIGYALIVRFSKSNDGGPPERATTLSLDSLSSCWGWFDRGVARSKDLALKMESGRPDQTSARMPRRQTRMSAPRCKNTILEEQSQISTFLFKMNGLIGYHSIGFALNVRFSKSNDGGPQERATTPSLDPGVKLIRMAGRVARGGERERAQKRSRRCRGGAIGADVVGAGRPANPSGPRAADRRDPWPFRARTRRDRAAARCRA